MHIILDSTPVGLLTSPSTVREVVAINESMREILTAGHKLYMPEVIDYEIRRELIRANKIAGIRRLDRLRLTLGFVPINSDAILLAANLWAQSRRRGTPTGDPKRLDIDV